MTCDCPAWKNYRDTEEVCEEIAPTEGGIYFEAVPEMTVISTLGGFSYYDEAGSEVLEQEPVTIEGAVNFYTDLPNKELGTWRFEFSGSLVDGVTINDFIIVELGEFEGEYYHNGSITNDTYTYTAYLTVDCGEYSAVEAFSMTKMQWEGTLEIYFDLLGNTYGPLVILANVPLANGSISCY